MATRRTSATGSLNKETTASRKPISDRKARLQALLADHGPGDAARIRFVDHLETGGDAVLKSACRLALEGIVSKRLDAPYCSGRTNSWTKAK